MLNDATCFREVYIVCGYTDLRSGMDRLAPIVQKIIRSQFQWPRNAEEVQALTQQQFRC